MRVIAGKCRSLPLKTVPGRQTRPTTDRIKETLFNMLQPYLPDARFLDLFAGSGAIGIEALSRGAERAWFVEQNKAAADCIRQNLKFTKLEQQAVLLPMEAHAALQSLQGQEPFDCIFMDPPYDKGLEKDVLYAFAGGGLSLRSREAFQNCGAVIRSGGLCRQSAKSKLHIDGTVYPNSIFFKRI